MQFKNKSLNGYTVFYFQYGKDKYSGEFKIQNTPWGS